ncbi:xanthine dehydrogenase family protein molybdopterin-binding subunit [Jiella sp. MQZ9-1]|uniref:Xanthine dehydrogenase family protein molybdopterin-binding subunit n=1 Tax=Jiella flava TaxID=2816857 RepID=A0A939FUN9_9HYPH|nr:xanthine dehydrogenase family protein molybdopterin-binding subunit [Jiella flava]MBO0661857.1 xanthine dehydrogenase family protein molybdopterin-binding subunit [Jiella flava]MCD2470497.1 xanthine dehydrogenase family protein molybdopterin-binding subunit [Jiella flava]
MAVMTPKFGLGASVVRLEDDRLIRGAGRYTDDESRPEMLHAAVVRSPHASARFTIADLEAAKAAPGVRLVLTHADVAALGDIPCVGKPAMADGSSFVSRNAPVLCKDVVRHVGDAVAFVVAESAIQAKDAAELIEVDYGPLEAVADLHAVMGEGAPLVWPEAGSNVAGRMHVGDKAATDRAFAEAARTVAIDVVQNRLVCNYMEVRSAIGEFVEAEGRYQLTSGSQGVHGLRDTLASAVFKVDPSTIRVVTRDVGGGFGTKAFLYREYALVLFAGKKLGRPVKWTADRGEHFVTDTHGRDNVVTAEMAIDADGRFTGLRINIAANLGAYTSQFGPMIPWFGMSMATGLYDIPAIDVACELFYTNTVPVDAYRGAGRPEAAYLIERLVDKCAAELGVAREEIRRQNFIKPEQLPYKTAFGRLYDTGDFVGHMSEAMRRAGWADFEARRESASAGGKLRGIGMATYVEACAFPGSEPAYVELTSDGRVTLKIGTQSNGQGHETAYAQFVAEALKLDYDRIEVRQGDTDDTPTGGGTGGSRSIPLGAVSVRRASQVLADKLKKIASDELEAAVADIELEGGLARVAGTDRTIDFAALAKAAKSADDLKATGEFKQDECTYPNGTHICEVEVDEETGVVEIVAYTIVDDFGVTVNPRLLAGQIHGGVAQGLGQALLENTVYAEDGQLISASFMDYAMPRAWDLPMFDFKTRNVPSTTNALGIKGAGEAGTIGAAPAVMNAVADALRPAGVERIDMPATPLRVWEALQAARAGV